MEDCVAWDVMPFIPVDRCQRFGGTCYLRLQGRRVQHGVTFQKTAIFIVTGVETPDLAHRTVVHG
jgi:hypothetical protein